MRWCRARDRLGEEGENIFYSFCFDVSFPSAYRGSRMRERKRENEPRCPFPAAICTALFPEYSSLAANSTSASDENNVIVSATIDFSVDRRSSVSPARAKYRISSVLSSESGSGFWSAIIGSLVGLVG